MKSMKKFASLLLALVMALALTVPAFADDAYTITVTNPHANTNYEAYKIFDVEYSGDSFSYTINKNSAWYDDVAAYDVFTLTASAADPNVFIVDATNFKTEADAAAFAAYLNTKVAGKTADVANSEFAPSGDTLVATVTEPGYYFVTSALGSLCSLNTTSPNANIQEKNDEPTLKKEVKEDSTGEFGGKNHADVGDIVEFKATIVAKPGAENYVMHDKMDTALDYVEGSVVVKLLKNETEEDVAAENYTVKETGLTDGCTFEVAFTKAFLDAQTASGDATIIVYYNAKLTAAAKIAPQANVNDAHLSYGENNEFTTTPSHTDTYTYEFDLVKYDGSTKDLLDAAEFTLTRGGVDSTDLISFVAVDGSYRVATAEDNTTTTTITVTDGKVKISGLDADTYTLRETKAPQGYNPLTGPVTVVINADPIDEPTVTVTAPDGTSATGDTTATIETNDLYGQGGVAVANNTGVQMPSTGGIGTTIFYALGGLMVVAAGILLVTKRRMYNK